jgi:hypothetical protein
MRRFLAPLPLLLVASLVPLACSSSSSTGAATGFAGPGAANDGQGGGTQGGGSGGGHGAASGGGSGSSSGSDTTPTTGGTPAPPSGGGISSTAPPGDGDAGPAQGGAGILTAGAWDDVLNPDVWSSFVKGFAGPPAPTTGGESRIVVQVLGDGDVPVSGAVVTIGAGGSATVKAPTGSDGRAILVPSVDHIPVSNATITVSPAAGRASFTAVTVPAPTGDTWTVRVPGAAAAPPQALDLAFVVDTTGSMGDELSYIQTTIDGVATQVATQFPNVAIRYGLVVYRDTVDIYVTRSFNFSDRATFEANLNAQSADGGGDYPESMERGLTDMNQLSWSDGNVARVAFLVADAPPHTPDIPTAFTQMNAARLRGVRLYGVAGSGAAEDAEYILRAGAQVTGARYLFLTDDSGVGDTHEVPHIPCYQVEHLDRLVERVIASELTGKHVATDPNDVVRTVGSPVDGVCQGQSSKSYLW